MLKLRRGKFLAGDMPKLQMIPVGWRAHYILLETIKYQTSRGDIIEVPKGIETDLASIPGFLPAWMHRPSIQPAAIVHDWLYSVRVDQRRMCDAIFLEAMLSTGTGTIRAIIYYFAVRVFGWFAWSKIENKG